MPAQTLASISDISLTDQGQDSGMGLQQPHNVRDFMFDIFGKSALVTGGTSGIVRQLPKGSALRAAACWQLACLPTM